jgi:hypothetical protein
MPQVESASKRYHEWLRNLKGVEGPSGQVVARMVSLLNEYKLFVDVDLIFDGNTDFLYRQKGQLKLDNSIIEEFLPLLVATVLSEELQGLDLSFGPVNSFSALRFEENIGAAHRGAGMAVRSKDQDFAITRKLFLRASHQADFREAITEETSIAYVASEIKTNLDKTMFQEAAATALDVKTGVPGAKYYLLCEWLDMTPISTSTTPIDEIVILRRAKRLSSSIRSAFGTVAGRRNSRTSYVGYLTAHPLAPETFSRFLSHIRQLVSNNEESDILARGYF